MYIVILCDLYTAHIFKTIFQKTLTLNNTLIIKQNILPWNLHFSYEIKKKKMMKMSQLKRSLTSTPN